MSRLKNFLFIASDQAGTALRKWIQEKTPHLQWKDLSQDEGESDYPDSASILSHEIKKSPDSLGVLICGSGIGVSIAANRFKNIRAAHVQDPLSARLAREHNHANVLCLGSRILGQELALECLKSWLLALPSEEERHLRRVEKLS